MSHEELQSLMIRARRSLRSARNLLYEVPRRSCPCQAFVRRLAQKVNSQLFTVILFGSYARAPSWQATSPRVQAWGSLTACALAERLTLCQLYKFR